MKHIRGKKIAIVPHKKDVWNQTSMSYAYGYDETIEANPEDSILFSEIVSYLHKGYSGIQMLTISTHMPYHTINHRSTLDISSDFDGITQDYIRSFNYFDSQLNTFLESVETDSILHESTIIITGDHTASYPIKEAYCPLLVISPHITESRHITDVCYQMDIYPTIKNILNIKGEWLGFGCDMLDSLSSRQYPEESAYVLSDKLIRSDYFALPIDARINP